MVISARRINGFYTPKNKWRPLQSSVYTSVMVYQYFPECVQLNTNLSKSSGIRIRREKDIHG